MNQFRDPEKMEMVTLLFDWRDDGWSWLIVDPVTDEGIRARTIEVFYCMDLTNSNDGCLEVPLPATNIKNFKNIVEHWRAFGEP